MATPPHQHPSASPPERGLGGPLKIALLMIAAIGVFYLLREHWSHVAGNWIYLLLLACPLMHFFHGGHGGHGGHGDHGAPPNKPGPKED